MIISKVLSLVESLNSRVYLHGGPAQLDGGNLKRGGRKGHDMGALFFVPENEDGYKHAIGYAISRSPRDWAVYRVRLNAPDNKIFNFTNPRHKKIAQQHSPSQYQSWEQSKGTSGHLDWTAVDEELLEEWGFKGAIFHERSKDVVNSNQDIISIGIFDPNDASIISRLTKQDIIEKMPHLYQEG